MHVNHIRYVAGDGVFSFALVVNIVGLILGFLMLLSPHTTLSTLRWFAGIYLVLLGMDGVVTAVSRMGTRY